MMPGLYPDLSYADYCAIPAVRASSLHAYGRSALHARYRATHPHDSASLALGRAVHAAVLEPAVYERRYVSRERATGTGSRALNARLAARAVESGLVELADEDRDAVEAMRAQVLAHPVAGPLISEAVARELTAVWVDEETRCKARLDILGQVDGRTVIADLKTCRDASPRRFGRDAIDYSYHESAAWYLAGLAALDSSVERSWLWIAVESEPPHAVAVYEPSQDLLAAGASAWREHLTTHLECRRSGAWPGYSESVMPMDCPAWLNRGER